MSPATHARDSTKTIIIRASGALKAGDMTSSLRTGDSIWGAAALANDTRAAIKEDAKKEGAKKEAAIAAQLPVRIQLRGATGVSDQRGYSVRRR